MKKKKSIAKLIAVSVAAACFVSTATPIALAAEQTIEVKQAGDTADVPLKITPAQQSKIFSATVSAEIPMEQKPDGTVLVASGAKIQNNNPDRGIKVSKLEVDTATGWDLVAYDTDMTQYVNGEKKVALQLDATDKTKTTQITAPGEVAINGSDWTIGKGGSKPINLKVAMPKNIQTQNDAEEQFGTLHFTLDWADTDPSDPTPVTKYTVTLQPGQYGSINNSASFEVEANGTLPLPSVTPDAGYRLEKWINVKTGATVTAQTKVTADITIQPVFVADTVTVTFKAGPYGSLTGNTSVQVQPGTTATFPAPRPDTGYLFDKWVDQDGKPVTPATVITQTMTITAQFREDASDPTWFNINDSGYITGFSDVYMQLTDKETDLKIPKQINGKDVYGIADAAFMGKPLSEADMEYNGLTRKSDAEYAANAAIRSVELPDTASRLNKFAFNDCQQLHSVNLKNVTFLGERCFQNCVTLQNINLSKVTRIEKTCFNVCRQLHDIDLSRCTSLGNWAFSACSRLTSEDQNKIRAINPSALS